MRIILLGAPGAGKGSVAGLLKEKHPVRQISTGDMLRSAITAGTELGRTAEGYMKRGELVPDSLIMGIMEHRLAEPDCKEGFILDGFPRTIAQADGLKHILGRLGIRLDAVVNLEVPREVLIRRLTSRRTCSNPECQAIFNIYTRPPRVEGVCDNCGGKLVQRDDETEEAIAQRLVIYGEKTAPLIDYYRGDPAFISVDGMDANAVVADVEKAVAKRK